MTETRPLVSVIIPTYNRPQLLRRAIQSVVDQTFINWELIVVQNGGTRESEAVVSAFNDIRMRYVYEPKACPVHARNVGVQASGGVYVAFLDDDDEWLPRKLERQLNALERNTSIGLVSCPGQIVTADGAIVRETPTASEMTFKKFLVDGCLIWSLSSVLVRKACFDQVGLFDEAYPITNDYDFYFRLSKRFQCLLLVESLYRYYSHQGNLSKDTELVRKETLQLLESLEPATQLGVTRKLIRIRMAQLYYLMAIDAFDAGKFRIPAKYYFKAVCFDLRIGVRFSWGRFTNPIYKVLRPYFAIAYCGLRSFKETRTP